MHRNLVLFCAVIICLNYVRCSDMNDLFNKLGQNFDKKGDLFKSSGSNFDIKNLLKGVKFDKDSSIQDILKKSGANDYIKDLFKKYYGADYKEKLAKVAKFVEKNEKQLEKYVANGNMNALLEYEEKICNILCPDTPLMKSQCCVTGCCNTLQWYIITACVFGGILVVALITVATVCIYRSMCCNKPGADTVILVTSPPPDPEGQIDIVEPPVIKYGKPEN